MIDELSSSLAHYADQQYSDEEWRQIWFDLRFDGRFGEFVRNRPPNERLWWLSDRLLEEIEVERFNHFPPDPPPDPLRPLVHLRSIITKQDLIRVNRTRLTRRLCDLTMRLVPILVPADNEAFQQFMASHSLHAAHELVLEFQDLLRRRIYGNATIRLSDLTG